MNVKCVVTGYLDENCYILSKNGTCLIVDPGDDFLKIKEAIGDDKVLGVLITHSHVDHIGALRNFLTKRSIKIFKRSNLEEKEYEIGMEPIETLSRINHDSPYSKEHPIRKIDGIESEILNLNVFILQDIQKIQ